MSTVNIEIKRKDELTQKKWSGGVTTQLAIWPREADYAARSFDWRVSTAVIEEDSSIFTPLPGIHRHLMLLKGGIELTHKGKESRLMLPLADVEEFEGDWETSSAGRCVDFNLMTAEGYGGKLSALAANKKITLPTPRASACWYALYAVAGLTAELRKDGRFARAALEAGDFILISYDPSEKSEIELALNRAAADIPAVCAAVWREC
ncbi:MAG: HutD family protein [Synergistaceae bacterium]|nr:HutD family protein [Synergistaceae bacterium]